MKPRIAQELSLLKYIFETTMVSWNCDCVPSYIPTYMACPLVPRIAPNKKQFTLVRSDEMSVLYLEPLKYRKPDRKLISNWATLALFDMDLMEAVDLKSSKLFVHHQTPQEVYIQITLNIQSFQSPGCISQYSRIFLPQSSIRDMRE